MTNRKTLNQTRHNRRTWWKRVGSILAGTMLAKSHPEW
jgi:hypothetical protein